jgi:hypothetical protein
VNTSTFALIKAKVGSHLEGKLKLNRRNKKEEGKMAKVCKKGKKVKKGGKK